MAVSKISFIFIALIFASNYSPACGQAARTPVDFWLTFGQQLTSNVLNWFLNLDLIPDDIVNELTVPPTPAPLNPNPMNPNQIRIAIVNGQPVILPANAPAPSVPAPVVPAPQPAPAPVDPTWQLWKVLWDLYAPQKPAPVQPAPVPNYIIPTTQSPCTTTQKCQGSECKPEKVRIVVVDDCKNKKHSSESCSEESSEEVDVIVPRKKHSRWH